jgi:hypothetical protein
MRAEGLTGDPNLMILMPALVSSHRAILVATRL